MVTLRCQILDHSVDPEEGKTCVHQSHGDPIRIKRYGCWVCRYSGQSTFDEDDMEE